jgi:DNA-binding transcriptional ArsR family regulator
MSTNLELNSMRDSADVVVNVLKSLANTDRLIILCHLAQQELNVSQIENMTDIKQPTLSQQLMMLRKSDVVMTRRAGKQIFYSIKDQHLIQVLNQLHQLYC